MIFTLHELETNYEQSLNFTLDFSKEIKNSSSISKISPAEVNGSFYFIDDNQIRFDLEVFLNVTMIAADTNNPIEVPMHVVILDDVSDDEKSEYKIINHKIDLYELVWGWVAAELPYGVFEDNTMEVF